METLLFYELVLLIAGAILFLALLFVLLFSIVKNKPIKNVFWFFIFPIIMIGFPSFQSFTFENDLIKISAILKDLQNDPKNEQKREELEKTITSINPARIEKNVKASKFIAKAQLELGNIPESETAIQNALKLEKNDPEAKAINNDIQKEKKNVIQYNNNIKVLNKILSNVDQKDNASPQEINTIKEILIKTEIPKYTTEKSQIVIAKSLNQIGDKESSSKVIENVLATNPASREAIAVQKDTAVNSNVSSTRINAAKFEKAIIKN